MVRRSLFSSLSFVNKYLSFILRGVMLGAECGRGELGEPISAPSIGGETAWMMHLRFEISNGSAHSPERTEEPGREVSRGAELSTFGRSQPRAAVPHKNSAR